MSRLDDMIASGLDRLRQVGGRSVTYTDGTDSVVVTAVRGTSSHDQLDDTGMPVTAQSMDYLVKASDLVLGGSVVKPVAGHQIIDGGATFAVRSVGSEAPWRYSDLGRTTIRIHVVEVS